jgi:pyruvate/2-oxoglutarate dehydrogenase complex dihydrolipoamide acyltransferase (E2) component
MNRMRQKIASRLKEAQNVNAMLTTFNEIDMSSIMEFRKMHQETFQKRYGIKLGFMSAFCKAAAYALQDQPTVNAVIEDNVSTKRQKNYFIRIKCFKKNNIDKRAYIFFAGNCIS